MTSSEIVPKLDAVIDRVINRDLYIHLAMLDDQTILEEESKMRIPEYVKAFSPVIENIKSLFQEYRFRFYLLNSFVQQQVLSDRAGFLCQSAMFPSNVDDSPHLHSVHPLSIIGMARRGIFYDEGISFGKHILSVLTPNNTPICKNS